MFNGERVKELISEKKMTQTQFAESIGISPSAFTQMIGKKGNPTTRNAETIAEALGVSISELFVSVIKRPDLDKTGSPVIAHSTSKVNELSESEMVKLLKKIIETKDDLISEKEKLVKEKERVIQILLKEK